MAARIIACVLLLVSALCAITLAILVPLLRLPGIIWAAVMLANIARIILGNMIKNRYRW